MARLFLFSLLVLLSTISIAASTEKNKQPEYFKLPSLREQARLKDSWTKERLGNIPNLLQKYRVDAWLISQKEYGEDTVFWSLKPATSFSARRRTTTLILADSSTSTSSPTSYTWIDNTPQIWTSISHALSHHNPKSIAINVHPQIAFSSGLHAGEFSLLKENLGPKWSKRFVSIPMIAVEFVGTMPKGQLEWYRKIMSTAWGMIKKGFSEEVIVPGKTSTRDLEWWFREEMQKWGYGTWFMPSVSILPINEGFDVQEGVGEMTRWSESSRKGEFGEELRYLPGQDGFKSWGSEEEEQQGDTINHGDLLHIDFGISAMGMNTDTQHLAYVLAPGETEKDIPKSYKEGLKKGNCLQDILRSEMKIGLSGNEILKNALDKSRKEGIKGSIYSHPIGDWGHSAGTLIGMTNLQSGVPILGDLPLLKDTYYSIELYAEHFVPERNRTMRFYLEEDVYWDENTESWEWVFGRQDQFWVIRTKHKGKDTEGGGGDGRENARFKSQY